MSMKYETITFSDLEMSCSFPLKQFTGGHDIFIPAVFFYFFYYQMSSFQTLLVFHNDSLFLDYRLFHPSHHFFCHFSEGKQNQTVCLNICYCKIVCFCSIFARCYPWDIYFILWLPCHIDYETQFDDVMVKSLVCKLGVESYPDCNIDNFRTTKNIKIAAIDVQCCFAHTLLVTLLTWPGCTICTIYFFKCHSFCICGDHFSFPLPRCSLHM